MFRGEDDDDTKPLAFEERYNTDETGTVYTPSVLFDEHGCMPSAKSKWRFVLRPLLCISVLVFVAVVAAAITYAIIDPGSSSPPRPRNLIIMITDGHGQAGQSMTRQASGVKLVWDSYDVGSVNTPSADSLVTDSAAGATAYACGVLTYNGGVGVNSKGKPVGSILEAAMTKGMKVGLVATVRVTDATPGAFSAHVESRGQQEYIARQQIAKKVDLIFGGGRSFFNASTRSDKLDLIAQAQSEGYQYISTIQALSGDNLRLPLLGLFYNSDFPYEIDQPSDRLTPSLANMVSTALNLLSTNSPNGFFLMVEGSRIDHAGHDNDSGAEYREILAYNEAANVVLDFARANGETLVVATSDHETGGLSVGAGEYRWDPAALNIIQHSLIYTAQTIVGPPVITSFTPIVSQYLGMTLTPDEISSIANVQNQTGATDKILRLLGPMLTKRTQIAYTTRAHTGVSVPLYAFNDASGTIRGNLNNTQVSAFIQSIFEFDLQAETLKLQGMNVSSPSKREHNQDHYHM